LAGAEAGGKRIGKKSKLNVIDHLENLNGQKDRAAYAIQCQ
jgi:hypothetical protein